MKCRFEKVIGGGYMICMIANGNNCVATDGGLYQDECLCFEERFYDTIG